MQCQECGAPQSVGTEDCAFCGFQVAFQAASDRQRKLIHVVFFCLRWLCLIGGLSLLYSFFHGR